jgi:hypothetical protein
LKLPQGAGSPACITAPLALQHGFAPIARFSIRE